MWIKLWLIGFGFASWSVAKADQSYTVSMVTQFSLTGVKQVSDTSKTSVRISNKDILAALNDAGFSFSTKAQIVFLSVDGNLPSVAVREGTGSNVVTTDVSSYFSIGEVTEIHAAGNSASYAIYIFNFDNRHGTSFSVQGQTDLHEGNITAPGGGQLSRDKTLSATVAGSGSVNGEAIVIRGSVHGGSAKAELN